MLRYILLVSIVLSLALGGGVASAWYAQQLPPSMPAAAGWVPFPLPQDEETLYGGARPGRSFVTPLGANEGLAFAAWRSEDGAPLDPRCAYAIEGAVTPARFWTLFAADANGAPLGGTAGEAAKLQSLDVLQGQDGVLSVTASAAPVPGNWLKLPGKAPLALVLSLYDTPPAKGVNVKDVTLPRIVRLRCDA